MRIIKEAFLRAAAVRYPRALQPLAVWIRIVRDAGWQNPAEMRRTFPNADPVRVRSGQTVWVFNIHGNDYRLIAAVHFNRKRVHTLCFLTHAEYSKDRWKDEL